MEKFANIVSVEFVTIQFNVIKFFLLFTEKNFPQSETHLREIDLNFIVIRRQKQIGVQ